MSLRYTKTNGCIINVFVKQMNRGEKSLQLNSEATVDELYDEFSKKTGMKVDQYQLIYTKYKLIRGEGKSLKDYGIENNSTVFQVMRMRGGSDVISGFKIVYKGEDIITLEDDDTVPKVVMPCGHACSPESLTHYCQHELDEGKSTIVCPGDGCVKEYSYSMVRKAARLTAEKKREFESKIAENTCRRSQDIRQCPRCDNYSMRHNRSNPRVVCDICSQSESSEYEFCWDCLTEWGTKNHNNCKEEFALEYLRNCGRTTIGSVHGCPEGRACPKCYTLIEYIEGCKHMECPNTDCKCSFCFVCLKQKVATGWQCGIHNTVCEVAPVQDKFSQ